MKLNAIPFCGINFTDAFYRRRNNFLTGTNEPYGELGGCLEGLGVSLSEDNECETLIDFSQKFEALKRDESFVRSGKKIYICLEPPVVQVDHRRKAVKKAN